MYTLLETLDTSNLLNIDITRKQSEYLKQLMKQYYKLDYSMLQRNERRDFEAHLIKTLRDIQDSITKKRNNKEVVNMQEIFTTVTTMIENHISYVESVSQINQEFKSYSKAPKKNNTNYNLKDKQNF